MIRAVEAERIEATWMTFTKATTEAAKKLKTEVWLVTDRRGGVLGTIKWFSRWRQYCFFAERGAVFNRSCLRDIIQVTDMLMVRRRSA